MKKVVVMYANDDAFTKSGYDAFAAALEDEGIEVADDAHLLQGRHRLPALLTEAKESRARRAGGLGAGRGRDPAGHPGPRARHRRADHRRQRLQLAALMADAGDAAEGVVVGAAWNSSSRQPGEPGVPRGLSRRSTTPIPTSSPPRPTPALLLDEAMRAGCSAEPRRHPRRPGRAQGRPHRRSASSASTRTATPSTRPWCRSSRAAFHRPRVTRHPSPAGDRPAHRARAARIRTRRSPDACSSSSTASSSGRSTRCSRSGFTLVFGVLDRLNLAHAAVFTAGGVRRHRARRRRRAVDLGGAAARVRRRRLLGVVIDRAAFAPLGGRPDTHFAGHDRLDRRSARCSSLCCRRATAPDTRRFPPGSFPDTPLRGRPVRHLAAAAGDPRVVRGADARPDATGAPHPTGPGDASGRREPACGPDARRQRRPGHRETFAISSALGARGRRAVRAQREQRPARHGQQHRAEGPGRHHRRRHGVDPRGAGRRVRRSAWPKCSTIALHRLVLARRRRLRPAVRHPAGPAAGTARRAARRAGRPDVLRPRSSTARSSFIAINGVLAYSFYAVLVAGQLSLAQAGFASHRRVHRRHGRARPTTVAGVIAAARRRIAVGMASAAAAAVLARPPGDAAARRLPRDRHPRLRRDGARSRCSTCRGPAARSACAVPPSSSPLAIAWSALGLVAYWFWRVRGSPAGPGARGDPRGRGRRARRWASTCARTGWSAFVTAGAVAGLYGVLFAHFTRSSRPNDFDFAARRRRPGVRGRRRLDVVRRTAARRGLPRRDARDPAGRRPRGRAGSGRSSPALLLLVVILFLPGGLASLIPPARRACRRRPGATTAAAPAPLGRRTGRAGEVLLRLSKWARSTAACTPSRTSTSRSGAARSSV